MFVFLMFSALENTFIYSFISTNLVSINKVIQDVIPWIPLKTISFLKDRYSFEKEYSCNITIKELKESTKHIR